MAFHMRGDESDKTEITATGAGQSVVTSLERQDRLFAEGFLFEATIARAAMVEGLALHYLLLAKRSRNVVIDAQTLQRVKDQRITLGQIKDGLVRAKAFHDPGLESQLVAYVKNRNHVAHHVCSSGDAAFDFSGFFEDGRHVAFALWHHNCAEVGKLNLPP